MNVCLYGGHRRWAMTERSASSLQREATQLRIGNSSWRWGGDCLDIAVDEWAVPWPRRVRGRVRVWPRRLEVSRHALDQAGRHWWWPIAPLATIEVDLREPALRWRGHAYLDSNQGDEPLAAAFREWHWARAMPAGPRCEVVYDAWRRDGSQHGLALAFREAGPPERFEPPALQTLPAGVWGVARRSRADAGTAVHEALRLEDGPFYTRSLLNANWRGESRVSVQESLDLDRFDRRWVQALLPFRMPRRA